MSIFVHPSLKNMKPGETNWFVAQREMIQSKPAVRRCYDLWYGKLRDDVRSVKADGGVVEIGSGSSYVKRYIPEAITSDIVPGHADMVLDGQVLPFGSGSIRALLLTHTFHHIPDIRLFLREAERVLVPGGVISIIDCAHTALSRAFFGKVHPEPYDHKANHWEFTAKDNMADSNQALTWIVFERDGMIFKKEFPSLRLERSEYLPWLGYLLSGGVNLRSFVPSFADRAVEAMDAWLTPLDHLGAIHWHLTVRRC